MAGVITPADVIRFTEGDCHIFARYLHAYSGWPLATFSYKYKGEDHPELHAFVRHPSGDLVDIQGRTPETAFRERWFTDMPIRLWDEMPGEWDWHLHTFGTVSYWRALHLAPVVVASCS